MTILVFPYQFPYQPSIGSGSRKRKLSDPSSPQPLKKARVVATSIEGKSIVREPQAQRPVESSQEGYATELPSALTD